MINDNLYDLIIACIAFVFMGVYGYYIRKTDYEKLDINRKLDATKWYILLLVFMRSVFSNINDDTVLYEYFTKAIVLLYFYISYIRIEKLRKGL